MTAIEVLIGDIQDVLEGHINHISEGAPRDYAQYQYQVGAIVGLRSVLRRAQELYKYEEEA